VKSPSLTPELLHRIDAYWRAANYLSVGQIYLYDNPLLKRQLMLADVKHMLLGHWGTTPGQNFIYAHLNRVIKKYDLDMIYVSGPGHGGPAVASNTYLEDDCLRSRHYVNVVVAGKHPAPQWLTMDAAARHCAEGIGIWQWASNDQSAAPDVVMACCGDVPTLETLAAVSIMREHLPELKIRVVNVVDLMKLQPQAEHPHGLSDVDFNGLFTSAKPVIFAFHGYPWLIHRLTYRRTNHDNIHVRGYKEEGTITTPFDMTVLNDLDRFHLVMDTVDRLPQTGDRGVYLKQQLRDKLIEHRQYICKHGEDLPEVRNWKWDAPK